MDAVARAAKAAFGIEASEKHTDLGGWLLDVVLAGFGEEHSGSLPDRPAGQVWVPLPCSSRAWSECMRDLTRILQGGTTWIANPDSLSLLIGSTDHGDFSNLACGTAFDTLKAAIQDEIKRQGCGHLLSRLSRMGTDPVQDLVRQIAMHLTPGPGVQVAMHSGLPAALWQPTFVVCVGAGQVRVLTLAFVGEPVVGDRPTTKRTPFLVRLLTENLLTSVILAAESTQNPTEVSYLIRPASWNANTTSDHLDELERELLLAAGTGDWGSLASISAVRGMSCGMSSQGMPSNSFEVGRVPRQPKVAQVLRRKKTGCC